MNWLRGNALGGEASAPRHKTAGTLLAFLALAGTFFFAGTLESWAMISYNVSQSDAAVDYTTGETHLYSTVAVGGGTGSATYLGYGWFLTAYHVSTSVGTKISQNGCSTTVSYVDDSLKTAYNVDLRLFYCEDVSSLTSLTYANLASSDSGVWNSLSVVSYDRYTFRQSDGTTTYIYKKNEGTKILLVGNGRVRSSSDTNLEATSVTASGTHIISSGYGEYYVSGTYDLDNGTLNPGIAVWATTEDGSTQCTAGDSGGTALVEYGGEYYLIGVLDAVTGTVNTASFVDPTYENLVASKPAYTSTYILNLQTFADEILSIIKTNPLSVIPEPSFLGLFAGTLALIFAGTRRRRERER